MNAPTKSPIRSISSTSAQNNFGKLLEDAQKEPIVIQKNGRDQAVLLSVEDYNRLFEKETVDPRVRASMQRSTKRWNNLYKALAR